MVFYMRKIILIFLLSLISIPLLSQWIYNPTTGTGRRVQLNKSTDSTVLRNIIWGVPAIKDTLTGVIDTLVFKKELRNLSKDSSFYGIYFKNNNYKTLIKANDTSSRNNTLILPSYADGYLASTANLLFELNGAGDIVPSLPGYWSGGESGGGGSVDTNTVAMLWRLGLYTLHQPFLDSVSALRGSIGNAIVDSSIWAKAWKLDKYQLVGNYLQGNGFVSNDLESNIGGYIQINASYWGDKSWVGNNYLAKISLIDTLNWNAKMDSVRANNLFATKQNTITSGTYTVPSDTTLLSNRINVRYLKSDTNSSTLGFYPRQQIDAMFSGYVVSEADPIFGEWLGGQNVSEMFTDLSDHRTNWNIAYSGRLQWDGSSTGLTASIGRASLGLNNGAMVDTVEFANRINFKWNVSGQAQQQDSIRLIQGSNVTLTQNGATITIASSASTSSGTVTSITAGGYSSGGTITTSGTITPDTSANKLATKTDIAKITYSKGILVNYPTAPYTVAVWRTPNNITITAIHGVEIGGTNVVFMLTSCNTNGLSPSVVDVSDITATASNVNDDGSLSNPSISANNYVGIRISAVSGNVEKLIVTMEYTIP